MDKYLNFLIKNYSDIRAFEEVVGVAKKKLPEWVDAEVVDAILELRSSFFEQHELKVEKHKYGPWWYDPGVYSKGEPERHTGWYFMFGTGSGWESLFSNDRSHAPDIHLSVATDGISSRAERKKYVDQ